ncbi:TIR domain-containing protein [Fusobacterium nucleatum]|uniref:TIR domain-containing protein n=1 Tax=Fusobacterium nucleatum TaxID=851 RepID=UPI0030D5996C
MEKKIFLSYSHKNNEEATEIDRIFCENSITLTKDERDLHYKANIKEFMEKIREHDFAILLISEDYLLSESCMFEILEILKEKEYRKKILPIINIENFFKDDIKIEYIRKWNNKIKELKEKIREMAAEYPNHLSEYSNKLRKYNEIENNISKIIDELKKMKLVKYKNEIEYKFETLLKEVGITKKTENLEALNQKKITEKKEFKPYNKKFFIEKIVKGEVDSKSFKDILNYLIDKNYFCKFIIKNNEHLENLSQIINKLDEPLQKKTLENVLNNYEEATGYKCWENYDIFGRFAYNTYKNSSIKEIQNLSYKILDGCAKIRWECQKLKEEIDLNKYI